MPNLVLAEDGDQQYLFQGGSSARRHSITDVKAAALKMHR